MARVGTRNFYLRAGLVIFFILSVGALWVAVWFQLEHSRRDAINAAEIRTASLAHAFAEHTLDSIKRIDMILRDLSRHWSVDRDEFRTEFERFQQDIEDVGIQLAVAGPDGKVAFSSVEKNLAGVTIADREHFRVHLDATESRLFISRPVLGRLTGKWSVQFSRGIVEDGRLLGVMVLSVEPDHLARYLQTLPLGDNGAALIVRDDGLISVRTPFLEQSIGVAVTGTPYLEKDAPLVGNYRRVAVIDGIERIYGYFRLPQYGLTLVTGQAMTEVLAKYHEQRTVTLATAAGGSALQLILVLAILLALSRQARIERTLRERQEIFGAIVDQAADGIVLLDTATLQFVEFNTAAHQSLGYSREQFAKVTLRDVASEETARHCVAAAAKGEDSVVLETLHRHRDGTLHDTRVSASRLQFHGRTYFAAIWSDIGERKRAEHQLQLTAKVFDRSGEAIAITDADQRILTVNEAFTRATGYPLAEVVGKTPRLLASGRHDQRFFQEMWEHIGQHGWWQGEIWNRRKDGSPYLEWLSINAVRDNAGKVANYIGVFADLSVVKDTKRRIEFLATHDELTSLPNRALFLDRIRQVILRCSRDGTGFAIAFVDLDDFKVINDSLGHAAGDEMLEELARRLRDSVRAGDTVARFGGDEFALLIDRAGRADVELTLARIGEALAQPLTIGGKEFHASASIGICLYPADGADAETLLKNADAAMYQAKYAGKNSHVFFTGQFQVTADQRLHVVTGLRKAIDSGELRLHYQPQVEILTGRIVGLEALVRWYHPTEGTIPPARFIPHAEKSTLIDALGEWVAENAAGQVALWMDQGYTPPRISINLSPVQFQRGRPLRMIERVLERHRLPASLLTIELTESALMVDRREVRQALEGFRGMGVGLSIDDFGTGFSSLSSLRHFSIDELKIDRSFVQDLEHSLDARAITQTIIAMSATLGLTVVAEGVETQGQCRILNQLGCRLAQGYLFTRPVPADEVVDLFVARPFAPAGSGVAANRN